MFVFVCYALLCVHSCFAIILKRNRMLATLILSYICIVTINLVGLQCVIVIPDHTHLSFEYFVRVLYSYIC